MVFDRIMIDPKVMMGKPVIKGTRVSVELILKKLSQHLSPQEILEDYPHLTLDDIKAAVAYAATSIKNEEIHVIPEK